MLFGGRKLSYRFLITPTAINSDLYYDLSLAPAGFWSHVRSNGGDIRVFKQDGVTPVPREVSGFDYTNHLGSLFIGTSGGTAFYVYYGNPALTEPAANSTYGKYAVWESAAKLVAHLEDVSDSTVNQQALTNHSAVGGQTGKMAKAYTFNGSSQYIDTGGNVGNFGLTDSFSVCAWVYFSTDSSDRSIAGNCWGLEGWLVRKTSANKIRLSISNHDNYKYMDSNAITSGWHSVVCVWDGQALSASVYVDGSPQSITGGSSGTLTTISTSAHVMIGLDTVSDGHYWAGTIDEPRIYSRVLTSTEIANLYSNQNNCGAFVLTGAEQ